jgi:hypothetical protein
MLVPVTTTSEMSEESALGSVALETAAFADAAGAAGAAAASEGSAVSAARADAAAMSNTLTTPRTVQARQSLPEPSTL